MAGNNVIAKKVAEFLKANQANYGVIEFECELSLVDAIKAAKISPEEVIKAVPLTDGEKYLVAIIPFFCSVDIKLINQLFGAKYRLVSNKEATTLFEDCVEGSHPPFSQLYQIPAIIDEKLFERDNIIFQSGSNRMLISMPTSTFRQLINLNGTNSAPISSVNAFNSSESTTSETSQPSLPTTDSDKIESTSDNNVGLIGELAELIDPNSMLPKLPCIAKQMIQLLADPFTTPQRVTQSLAKDAQISTQVMRYARATCFTHSATIETLDEAVNKALGIDLVSSIALGVATIKAFRTPRKGPLGYISLWRHSMYSATLMHALARRIPNIQLRPSTAYLVGFTQNYGILALGHMFQFKYQTLNKLLETQTACDYQSMKSHSKQLGPTLLALNSDQASLGAWLLAQWDMPDAVVTAIGERFNTTYEGDFSAYVHLIQLSHLLLEQNNFGIGIGRNITISIDQLATKLNIDEDSIMSVARQVFAGFSEIECLASRLAA